MHTAAIVIADATCYWALGNDRLESRYAQFTIRNPGAQVKMAAGGVSPTTLLIQRVHAAGSHYDVLGVPTTAAEADLKKAFMKLALRLHPDKTSAEGAEEAVSYTHLTLPTICSV